VTQGQPGTFGPIVTEANRDKLLARLRANVIVTADGCWEWQRYRLQTGYGRMTVDHRMANAHRVSYELFVGPIPLGMFLCHHCDNPPCCNPEHLFVGTPLDNTLDAKAKGRLDGNRWSENNAARRRHLLHNARRAEARAAT
jgi:hypothetical protein